MPFGSVIPVKVAIRVRPFVKKELDERAKQCIQCYVEQNQLAVNNDDFFAFDYIYDPKSSQQSVYESCSAPLLKHLFEGYNCTIFAYGQTGSGKTFTMGTEETERSLNDNDNVGIIPRIVDAIFEQIGQRANQCNYVVKCSMLEIYEEKVWDLLANEKGEALDIRESEMKGIYVQDLTEKRVTGLSETMKHLEQGCRCRSKGETAMNLKSSRSHAVFTIFIQEIPKDSNSNDCSWQAKLHLVDLAGSERVKKTQATGQRLNEGIKINEGLSVLNKVMNALTERGPGAKSHIPYRESKLTRILQDSLGGNSHTLMIACVSPADSNCAETMGTLRYAERAKKIKNTPIVNQDPQAAEIQRLKHMLQELNHELLQLKSGTICVSRASMADSNDLDKAKEKLVEVELKNCKLNGQLAEQVASKAILMERLALVEDHRDKLLESVQQLKRALGDNIQSLENSENFGLVDRERQLEFMRQLEMEIPKLEQIEMIEEDDDLRKDDGTEDEEENDDDEQFAAKYVERQSNINREMEQILKQIRDKESLIEQTASNYEQIEKMRKENEKEKDNLTHKIEKLQKEKDELTAQVRRAGNSNKISEDRRKRLQELERELVEYKKKMAGLQKLEKLKAERDRDVTRLRDEIQNLKHLRVALVKQLKEESGKYRKWKLRYDREMNQLKQKERRREFEVTKAKRNFDQQLTVYRRKYEEAVSCNKRLQQQMQRQEIVRDRKFTEQQENAKLQNEIKLFLQQELDLVTGVEEARLHCGTMIEQRKEMSKQLRKKRRRLDKLNSENDGPPTKKRDLGSGHSLSSDNTNGEIENLMKEIEHFETDIELMSSEINQLQSKSSVVEQEGINRQEQRWTSIRSIVHAKCALKQLFDMTVNAKVDCLQTNQSAEELKTVKEDLSKALKENDAELNRQRRDADTNCRDLEEEMNLMKREHEANLCFVLNQALELARGGQMTPEMMEKFNAIQSKTGEVEELQELMAKQKAQNEELGDQLNKAKRGAKPGSKPLFRNVFSSSDISNMNALPPKIQKTRSSRLSKPVTRFGVAAVRIDESGEGESDLNASTDDESDYRETPLKKQIKPAVGLKRKTSDDHYVGCKCKGRCRDGHCGCVHRKAVCSENCQCSLSFCLNRQFAQNTSPHSRDASFTSVDSAPGEKAPLDTTFIKESDLSSGTDRTKTETLTNTKESPIATSGILRPNRLTKQKGLFKPMF